MITMANSENLRQYKIRLSLIVEQIVEKLSICLQIPNELHNNVLYHR